MRPTGLKRGAGANEYYSGCATEVGTLRLKAWFAAHAHAARKGHSSTIAALPRLQIKVSVVILIVALLFVVRLMTEVFHSFFVLRFRAGAETCLPVFLDCGWEFVHVREEHCDLPHIGRGESLIP